MLILLITQLFIFNETNDTSPDAGDRLPEIRMYYRHHDLLSDFGYYDLPDGAKSESDILRNFFNEFDQYLSTMDENIQVVDDTNQTKVKNYTYFLCGMWMDLIPTIAQRLDNYPELHLAFAHSTETLMACASNLLTRAEFEDLAVVFEQFVTSLWEGTPNHPQAFFNILTKYLQGGHYQALCQEAETYLTGYSFLGSNPQTREGYLAILDLTIQVLDAEGETETSNDFKLMKKQLLASPPVSSFPITQEIIDEIFVTNFYQELVNPLRANAGM